MASLRLAFLTAALIFSLTEAGFRMLSPIWFAFLLAIAGNSAGLAAERFSANRQETLVGIADRQDRFEFFNREDPHSASRQE